LRRVILLDTGPLGKITHSRKFPEFKEWFKRLTDAGEDVLIPEIADYELRRGLLRARDLLHVARLDHLHALLGFVPITSLAMRRAAEFWADSRQRGFATAADPALDGDVILAAQAITLGPTVVIATENIGHLIRYATASYWHDIS
jgi:predicted nucleic acid-binding protein